MRWLLASLNQWMWVSSNSGRQWWREKPEHAAVNGVTKTWTQFSDWITTAIMSHPITKYRYHSFPNLKVHIIHSWFKVFYFLFGFILPLLCNRYSFFKKQPYFINCFLICFTLAKSILPHICLSFDFFYMWISSIKGLILTK